MLPEQLWRDCVFAARRLRATPVFTIFAVASLALGVGATTAVYSAVHSLMWRPTGVQDAHRVVVLTAVQGAARTTQWLGAASRQDFEDLRGIQTTSEGLAASAAIGSTLTDEGLAEALQIEAVTAEYFRALGVAASLGRTIQPADDAPSGPAVVVISHAFWRTKLAADPTVVGRVVRLSGHPFEVVGVAAESFKGLARMAMMADTSAWVSVSSAARLPRAAIALTASDRNRAWFSVVGRLRPGRTVNDAITEFGAAGQRLDVAFPLRLERPAGQASLPRSRTWSASTYPDATSDAASGVLPVGTIVALVLLIACANLANLVIGRGSSRQHELAVRRALGASRWRLVREQLAESAIIAAMSAAGAYLVTRTLLIALAIDMSPSRGRIVRLDPQLNLPALIVAAVSLLLALVVFGVAPALSLTRQEVRPFITGDAGGLGLRWWRAQKRSISWQVTMSLGLFLIAVLCIRGIVGEARHDSGVDVDRLAVGHLSSQPEWSHERWRQAADALVAAVRQQPGVDEAAVSSGLPFGTITPAASLTTPDRPFGVGRSDTTALFMTATPGIFRVLGVPIVRGRAFDARDIAGSAPVVVISEHTARELFNTVDVVGRDVRLRNWPSLLDQTVATFTVVGVARDTDNQRLFLRNDGVIYVPLAQHFLRGLTVVARTSGDPASLMGPLRAAAAIADPELAIGAGSGPGPIVLTPMYENLRVLAALVTSLAVVALVLSMAGLYGVLSHTMTRRTREMGLRMALGAERRQIIRLVLKDGLRPVLEGLAVGLVFATLVRYLLGVRYPGAVALVEPVTSALACLPLVLAALIACYLPARRAARIEPNVALRDQ